MFHRFFDDRDISIHAPRMGSDGYFIGCPKFIIRISIHAPRMGSDLSDDYDPTHGRFEFQSTLPGWGATTAHRNVTRTASYFNPRSPDGERHYGDTVRRVKIRISIHAPRMGSDLIFRMILSIRRINFNPRSPDGERQRKRVRRAINSLFQSTLPGWGATINHAIPQHATMDFNPRSPDGERLLSVVGAGE